MCAFYFYANIWFQNVRRWRRPRSRLCGRLVSATELSRWQRICVRVCWATKHTHTHRGGFVNINQHSAYSERTTQTNDSAPRHSTLTGLTLLVNAKTASTLLSFQKTRLFLNSNAFKFGKQKTCISCVPSFCVSPPRFHRTYRCPAHIGLPPPPPPPNLVPPDGIPIPVARYAPHKII